MGRSWPSLRTSQASVEVISELWFGFHNLEPTFYKACGSEADLLSYSGHLLVFGFHVKIPYFVPLHQEAKFPL